MNVIILAAGGQTVADHSDGYPLCLTEIKGKPLIEVLLEKWKGFDVNFSLMMRKSDIDKYHLDSVVKQINNKAVVYPINAPTAGAVCTALMAIENINNNQSLVILNGDELLDIEYSKPIDFFSKSKLDAGVVVFDSIHPRYSYVRLEDGLVIEAAEKNPISRNATAGFYWYKKGLDFVEASFRHIRKQAVTEDPYFICPVFNEFILQGKMIGAYKIEKALYKPFKSQQQINQFQSLIENLL
jgi:NDP-sugar pyrophosphorylase family protein